MQPRLGPPQRGHTKPSGQRCRLNRSPHCCSSPNCARNSCTVSILDRDLLPDFFIEITISPYLRLSKMDIHLSPLAGRPINGSFLVKRNSKSKSQFTHPHVRWAWTSEWFALRPSLTVLMLIP